MRQMFALGRPRKSVGSKGGRNLLHRASLLGPDDNSAGIRLGRKRIESTENRVFGFSGHLLLFRPRGVNACATQFFPVPGARGILTPARIRCISGSSCRLSNKRFPARPTTSSSC